MLLGVAGADVLVDLNTGTSVSMDPVLLFGVVGLLNVMAARLLQLGAVGPAGVAGAALLLLPQRSCTNMLSVPLSTAATPAALCFAWLPMAFFICSNPKALSRDICLAELGLLIVAGGSPSAAMLAVFPALMSTSSCAPCAVTMLIAVFGQYGLVTMRLLLLLLSLPPPEVLFT